MKSLSVAFIIVIWFSICTISGSHTVFAQNSDELEVHNAINDCKDGWLDGEPTAVNNFTHIDIMVMACSSGIVPQPARTRNEAPFDAEGIWAINPHNGEIQPFKLGGYANKTASFNVTRNDQLPPRYVYISGASNTKSNREPNGWRSTDSLPEGWPNINLDERPVDYVLLRRDVYFDENKQANDLDPISAIYRSTGYTQPLYAFSSESTFFPANPSEDVRSIWLPDNSHMLLYENTTPNSAVFCADRSVTDLNTKWYPNTSRRVASSVGVIIFKQGGCPNTITPEPNITPPTPTNTPHPPTSTPQLQSCTNPPPDRNVAYLFDNENCVNPWNWSSGHPSDSANRNAKSAWMPSGKVLLLSEHNSGAEPTVCLQSPVRNLADIGWGDRVEWASLRDSCPAVSGPNHSPGTPQLSSPGNWSEVRTADGPELCWQAVSDPDGDSVQYQVDIFESAVTTNSGWISGTCWRATRLVGQYFGYQWRVKAKDSRGAESGWSERRHFTLSAPVWNPPPPTPTPQTIPTQNPVTGNWWNSGYAYRRPLQITTSGPLAAGTLMKVDNIDIDALVSQGRIRGDYNDLRVVQRLDEQRWQEVARVVYSGWDLEFQLPATLSATTDNTYYLYYGNPNAGAPPTFSLPQGWWVDMHKTKWWDSLAGTWEHAGTMDFNDVCSAPLNHRNRVGTTFDDSDRFRGRLFIPTSGLWTFRVYTNDGYYLKLGGGEVGHDHGYSGNRWATIGSRNLKAGWHKFDAGDMWVNCGAWKLTMAGPNFADQIIPAHFFQKTYNNVKDGISTGLEEPYLLPTPTATLEPDCGTLGTEAIILFQDRDCHGANRQFITPNLYNLGDFENVPSAVYVPSGWSVRLFSETNGLGHTYCARESKWNLAIDYYEADGPLIDHSVSSIEVFTNAECAPPLQLIEPLTLEPANPAVGELVTASYTVKNVGSYPVYLHGVGVVARGPNCTAGWGCTPVQDFPVHQTITLAPGESYRYNATRTYTEIGDGYFAEPAFANRNWWWYPQPESAQVSFSVTPGLKLIGELSLSPTAQFSSPVCGGTWPQLLRLELPSHP